MKKGEMTRGLPPLSTNLRCVSSMSGRPPMPEPTTTANRSRFCVGDGHARVLHREVGRPHRVVDEGVHLLDLLLLDVEGRVEALHLAGDAGGEARGVEAGDRADAAPSGE